MVGIKHDFDWTGPGRGAKSCYIELKGTAKDIGLSGADKRVTIGQCERREMDSWVEALDC